MTFVHGGPGGSNLEALLVSVPLVVLGLVFFFQKSAPAYASLGLIAVGLGVGYASFTVLAHEERAPSAAGDPTFIAAAAALCEAWDVAAEDAAEAERIFFAEVHSTLHVMAAELDDIDRAAAADLLELKNVVESLFASDQPAGDALRTDLAALVEAAGAGLEALDVAVPACA